jgi:putative glutamine amidotransferase
MNPSAQGPVTRIGIYGPDQADGLQARGCGLWPVGNAASVTAAGGTPVPLQLMHGCSWDEFLDDFDGVVFAGEQPISGRRQAEGERLCEWCRELGLPLLAIDQGMHILNTTFGGTIHTDLPKELPQALQHRHPPEEGLRHALAVVPGTHLARFYGDGEIVVNSMHRHALNRVGRGFQVTGRALDGVIESIESETDEWFAMGVQWHPASATASGLDIQLFRGFIDVCRERQAAAPAAPVRHAA